MMTIVPIQFVFTPDGKEHIITIRISPDGKVVWAKDNEEEMFFLKGE